MQGILWRERQSEMPFSLKILKFIYFIYELKIGKKFELFFIQKIFFINKALNC